MTESGNLLRAGDRAWLVDVAPERIAGVVAAARAQTWSALLEDVVPAARSIMFRANTSSDMRLLSDHVRHLVDTAGADASAAFLEREPVVIPVRYDGEDLEEVARRLGMTTAAVVAAHTSAEHRVGFFGFAPGFAYIDGLPDALELPRRTSPRRRVGAGLVAIAGTQTVVYPGGTPGGWHLIGSTSEVLWDIDAVNPNRLSVGDRVVFEAVE
ncbi:5-oxoprolinase subunit B family protein [Rhodococcus koreensis]|uniref:Sensor histidine kinase inhibitor, KipI family n=1 Tax=Rhodococcus koreensis TaxID=99653 RepID=A0A1H4WA12_9NOCA|nr:allophanate hydrolase subunit 1 [Rhodococcus koreensis]SEC90127.1 sensor histidine kinase inhibitor, KipI family [Rhodococcus koreensis]